MLQRRTWRGIREQRCGEQRIRRACCGSKCGEKERPQEVEHLLVGATRRTLGAKSGLTLVPNLACAAACSAWLHFYPS